MSRPPSQQQSMGNTGMNYQYSQCTGTRKALLIGINYIGTKSQLRGCINDANAMQRFLIDRYGYKAEDIVMLTDDQREMVKVPTKANIIRAMQWLVSEARPNDSLVFHYSGHGGLEKNLTGEEESGYDSCIYPVDYETAGSILDDVMHDILVKPLPQGARLTAFFDSCHSGTALDLPFIYSTKGVIKEPNIWKDVGMNGLNAVMSYASGNIGGVVSSLSSAFSRATQGDYNRQQAIAKNISPADVIMISGSKDEQTSADATTNGLSTGAMSYAFISVMASQPEQTYISLLNNMRSAMSGKYSQKPQLSSSHPIDTNLRFIM
ncbi:Metacaspase-1 [Cyberlindnera fabianii]|nr:Metacaspase-1 [Cyberlindnera fabianii]